jgi:hypothetical protein
LAVIAKRLPDVHDVAIKGRIPYKLTWPHMLEQFLLEDYPVIMHQEIGQHLIHLGPQRDGHTAPVQFIALGIEAKVTKDIAHGHMLRPSGETSFRPEHRSCHASYHKNFMNILCNLYATFMLWGLPGGIFPTQCSYGRSARPAPAADRLPHEEASGTVTGLAERR